MMRKGSGKLPQSSMNEAKVPYRSINSPFEKRVLKFCDLRITANVHQTQ